MIFGTEKNEAMAYVITKEGATYKGIPLKSAPPGDFNTSLTIAETNSSMGTALTIKEFAGKITNEKLKEQLEDDEQRKQMLGENQAAFNDALSAGDAITALQILANEIYKEPTSETDQGDDMKKLIGEQGDEIKKVEKKIEEQEDEIKKDVKEVTDPLKTDVKEIKESLHSLQEQIKEINSKKDTPQKVIIQETNIPQETMNAKQKEEYLI